MPELSCSQLATEVRAGTLRPVYALVGPEQHLAQAALSALRTAVLGSDGPSLNEDVFDAADVSAARVVQAARTLSLFSPRRLVTVRGIERWEPKSGGSKAEDLELLADYTAAPCPSATLVLCGESVDNRRRWVSATKQHGAWVSCARLKPQEVPRFVRERLTELGHGSAGRAAELLSEWVGPDLGALHAAIERVSLFLGPGAAVTEEAVFECVAQANAATVWELVAAVARRDAAEALRALDAVFEPGEGPRLVGLLCWSARQWIRFASARGRGLSIDDAARQSGIPPFKAREVASQVQALPLGKAERWLEDLYALDRALKGGSRLPQRALLEDALLQFCQP